MMYRVIERHHGVGGGSKVESLHPSYLDALLYVRDRSFFGVLRTGRDVEIREDGILVAVYTGERRPSAEEIRSAVEHPERAREFCVGLRP